MGGISPSSKNSQTPLQKADLIGYFAIGCKPRENWKIGIEMERLAFDTKNLRPIAYDAHPGVADFLNELTRRFAWTPIYENQNIIGLMRDNYTMTIEPGGVIEFSGSPQPSVHHCCKQMRANQREIFSVAADLGIGLLSHGFDPKWSRHDYQFVPKQRYAIMQNYMPKVGTMGLDMMLRTASIQFNLDFSDESDMVQKMRLGMALQPVIGAIFANSPFAQGKPSGFKSTRNHIWNHTDPVRSGCLPFVFDDSMGFQRYADYVLDVPMYFAVRDGNYIDASGQSFRDFLVGKLPALPGQIATMQDWQNHISCVFPAVRLKQFLEMRGVDAGPWVCTRAAAALWVGLLYDSTAQQAAYDLIRDWKADEIQTLYMQAPKGGLQTPFRRTTVHAITREITQIAHDGLQRRNFRDRNGADESYFLQPAWDIIDSGQTPADRWLEKFHGVWSENINPVYTEQLWED